MSRFCLWQVLLYLYTKSTTWCHEHCYCCSDIDHHNHNKDHHDHDHDDDDDDDDDDDCRHYHHHHYHYNDHYHYPEGWTDKLPPNVCYLGFDVASLSKCSQCFDLLWYLLPSRVKQPWFFKMLGTTYLTMQCCRPEELSPKPHCCLNLKYYDPVYRKWVSGCNFSESTSVIQSLHIQVWRTGITEQYKWNTGTA